MDLDMWGPTHDKEQTFQESKLKKRKVEAHRAGALTNQEVDEEVVNMAAAKHSGDERRRVAAAKKSARVANNLSGGSGPAREAMRGKTVFIEVDDIAANHVANLEKALAPRWYSK